MVDDPSSNEALHRLQASDPATGSHPDLHRMRELIRHKAPASQGSDRATSIDDDLLQGPRIRPAWVAAAAVAALGIGIGGYALGLQRGGDTVTLADQDNPLSPAGAGLDVGVSGGMVESVGSVSMSSSEGAERMYDPGPVRLTASEALSAEPTTGQVRILRSEEDPQEFLDTWTDAVGFEGAPMLEDSEMLQEGAGEYDRETGRWMIVSTEGQALNLNYSDLFRTESCVAMYESMTAKELETVQKDWEKMVGPDIPMPTEDDCIEPTGTKPTDEQAIAAASDFLREAGVPIDDYTVRVQDYSSPGSVYSWVEAYPEGAEYGPVHASAVVSPDGVVEAYATMGEMASLGDYPVISPAEAVERYSTREFAMEYGVSIAEDYEDVTDGVSRYIEPDMPDAPEVADGMPIPLLLKDKEVTGAELVPGTMYTQSGSMEVPTWKLTTDDGMYYTVIGLSEEAIEWQSWEYPEK